MALGSYFFCGVGSVWSIWGICAVSGAFGVSGTFAVCGHHFGKSFFLRIILVNYSFCRSSLFAKSFLCGHLRFLVYSFRLMVYSLQLVPLCRICRVLCHVPHACHVLPNWRVLFAYRILPVCSMTCFSPPYPSLRFGIIDNQ